MEQGEKVCVIGLGYVGLPTAALLASKGYRVHGVDINQHIVDTINAGAIHIREAGLDTLVKNAVSNGMLIASTDVTAADIFIITVPTPLKQNLIPDIDHVLSAARAIAPHVRDGNLVILESTSPVGTTEKIMHLLAELKATRNIHIAYCPERILPGATLTELVTNSRIIGGVTPAANECAKEFYESFVTGAIVLTDARTAEMTKLVENAYRNVNIAFANELSMICDETGIDALKVISLANRHPRVNVLQPGPGVGGHCIAVDPLFISHQARDSAKIITAAHKRNEEKTQWVLEKIRRAAYRFTQENHRPPIIALLGLAYKQNSDDVRESPSLKIAEILTKEKYIVRAVDPQVPSVPSGLSMSPLSAALAEGDLFVFLVAHDAFRSIRIKPELLVLDFCGAYEL